MLCVKSWGAGVLLDTLIGVSSLNVKCKVTNVRCRLFPQIIALTDNHNANCGVQWSESQVRIVMGGEGEFLVLGPGSLETECAHLVSNPFRRILCVICFPENWHEGDIHS